MECLFFGAVMCCQAGWDLVAGVSLLQGGLCGDALADRECVVSGSWARVSQQRRSPGSERGWGFSD